MKKFAKIMALALALCMVMSVAAFADNSTANLTSTDRVLNVTIRNVGNNEQVALLILKNGATIGGADEGILYVGQMESNGEGVAAFGNITIGGTEASVDIYAGNATYAAGVTDEDTPKYQIVGKGVALANETTEIVVDMDPDVAIVNAIPSEDTVNGNLLGSAVSAEFNFTLPTKPGLELTEAYMIWSLRTAVGGAVDSNTRYTEAINLEEYLGLLDGTVRLSVAFANGTQAGEASETITGAKALFKFVYNDASEQEIIPADDVINEKPEV